MATPHINSKEGDFAKTVLMPGDPLRAKFIRSQRFQKDNVNGDLFYAVLSCSLEVCSVYLFSQTMNSWDFPGGSALK